MKRRIDFQKLIDGGYGPGTELQVFDWILATGNQYKNYCQGLDQTIFGYSAYNHASYTNMLPDISKTMFIGFCNVLCRSPNTITANWKDMERASLCRYRMIDLFKEDYTARYYSTAHGKLQYRGPIEAAKKLDDYVGLGLEKKYFHPDYPDRTDPRILDMNFSTAGYGYSICFSYAFKQHRGSSWRYEISQLVKQGESVDMFLARAHRKIKRMLL